MKKEKKCLKFTGYLYLPEHTDIKTLRYFSARSPGRIIIFDEFNKKPEGKIKAFDKLGDMLTLIEKEKQKRIYKKLKIKKTSEE